MNKKAQFLSVDFVIALSLFVLILVTLFFSWDYISNKVSDSHTETDMTRILFFASTSLVETPGSPGNWDLLSDLNTSSVSALGLAAKDGVLNEDKINALVSLNATKYSEIKTILGVSGPGYEFGFDVFYYNGTDYVNSASFGNYNLSANRVYSLQRNFILSNSTKTKSYMRFYITQ